MSNQSLYWLAFNAAAFAAMFLAIPRQRIRQLLPFGFWLGFFLAGVTNWLGINMFGWVLPGDILFFGIPLLASAYFIPLAIGFAFYYPLQRVKKDWMFKIDYVLLFAAITTFLQSILAILGLWQGANGWTVAHTFVLAAAMHTVMTIYYLNVEVKQAA